MLRASAASQTFLLSAPCGRNPWPLHTGTLSPGNWPRDPAAKSKAWGTMSVGRALQPVFPCSAPEVPMERRRFEWFLYFGFTSNRIPHCGPNPNKWLHSPPPTWTHFTFNPPVTKEPGTKQPKNKPNARLLTPAKATFFKLFFKKHFPFCYQKECTIFVSKHLGC